MRKLALFFAGALLLSLQLLAQNTTISGNVLDARTGKPMADVTVTATGTNVAHIAAFQPLNVKILVFPMFFPIKIL